MNFKRHFCFANISATKTRIFMKFETRMSLIMQENTCIIIRFQLTCTMPNSNKTKSKYLGTMAGQKPVFQKCSFCRFFLHRSVCICRNSTHLEYFYKWRFLWPGNPYNVQTLHGMGYFPPYFCSIKTVETIFKKITFLTKIISRARTVFF